MEVDTSQEEFKFSVGDVVLVSWEDDKIYYAKLSSIDHDTKTCRVEFEDNSEDTADFAQIHGGECVCVGQTTA